MPPKTPDYVILHGSDVTAILEVAPGEAPLWRYWGPRLPDGTLPPAPLRATRATPSFSLTFDQPLSLFPDFGVGWYRASALLAHRAGRDFAHAVDSCRVHWIEPGRSVRFDLSDSVAKLEVNVTLRLDAVSDVLTCQTQLTNLGEDVLDVQWLAAAVLPLSAAAHSVRSFSGRHNSEFVACDDVLGRNLWRKENRRGLTSHDAFPGAVVRAGQTTQHEGLAFGAQLAWSGNSVQTIEWLEDGTYQWQLGEWLAPGEVRLGAGESIETPEVLATCSQAGLNGVAQNFHAAIRARMNWPGGERAPRRVHLNTWEGVYFDLEPARLIAMADAAAAIGIERFVLDDGWFHARRHDRAGLGDWWVDTDVFPEGLAPLANHVRALGMDFGLWVEPEMVNPDSDLFRAHPDWALQIEGRPLLTARNQLVLDLTREEVSAYLLEKLGALLDALPISYLKWDHNRNLTTAGSAGRPAYRRQVAAVYALIDKMRARWPHVEIESCAGGGGRIDAGILQRTHRFWTSDCIDARSRVDIQRGFLQFFPPEVMGAHVGTAPAHSTSRSQSMSFRAGVALPGHLGVELDPRTLPDADRASLIGWIDRYKALREKLHTGRVWLGEVDDGIKWQAHGSAQDLLVFVYRLEPETMLHTAPMHLPMLDASAAYRVRRLYPDNLRDVARTPAFDAMRGEGALHPGAWLKRAGLPLPAMKAEECLILSVTAT